MDGSYLTVDSGRDPDRPGVVLGAHVAAVAHTPLEAAPGVATTTVGVIVALVRP